jgi:hypothetical protein
MEKIISMVVAENIQELVDGNFNYINSGNVFYGLGEIEFELGINYLTNMSTFVERIEIKDTQKNIIDSFENQIEAKEKFYMSILEVETEFLNYGIHFIEVYVNNELKQSIPIKVINE